jgi:DMSO reductase anchor subunit
MNSEKLLDDFDVIFATVVNKIYIRKIVLALYARYTNMLRYLVYIRICGSFGNSRLPLGLGLRID